MRNICKINGCNGVCEGHGYCPKHYKRWKRYGSPHAVSKDTSGFVKVHRGEYKIFCGMKSRCYNSHNPSYSDYGGRGIKLCDRWLGVDGFQHFFADMGPRPKGMSIDRIDVNGDYSPSNCRWATAKEQANNRRPSSTYVWITYRGETKNFKEWCLLTGVNYQTAYTRFRSGKPLDEVFRPTYR